MTLEDLAFDSLPLPAIIHNESAIIAVNQAACQELETASPAQLIGLTMRQVVHDDAQAAVTARRELVKEGQHFTGVPTKLVTCKGNTVRKRVAAVAFRVGDRLLTLVVAHDVDYLIHEHPGPSRARQYNIDVPLFAAALDALPLPVLVNVGGTTIEYVNPATVRLLGASGASELIGISTVDITHPEMRELIRSRIELQVVGAERSADQPVKLQAFDGSAVRARLCGHFVPVGDKTYGVWVVTRVDDSFTAPAPRD